MNDTREKGKSILIAIGIIVLIFFNVGIFYTSRISHQTDAATSEPISPDKTAQLDTTGLDLLTSRTHVDIESKLQPLQSGRANPFMP